jgi:hypothetical protein
VETEDMRDVHRVVSSITADVRLGSNTPEADDGDGAEISGATNAPTIISNALRKIRPLITPFPSHLTTSRALQVTTNPRRIAPCTGEKHHTRTHSIRINRRGFYTVRQGVATCDSVKADYTPATTDMFVGGCAHARVVRVLPAG